MGRSAGQVLTATQNVTLNKDKQQQPKQEVQHEGGGVAFQILEGPDVFGNGAGQVVVLFARLSEGLSIGRNDDAVGHAEGGQDAEHPPKDVAHLSRGWNHLQREHSQRADGSTHEVHEQSHNLGSSVRRKQKGGDVAEGDDGQGEKEE